MIFLFSIVALSLFGQASSLLSIEREGDVLEEKTMRLVIPKKPLARGSLQIEQATDRHRFANWNDIDHTETRKLLQRIILVWNDRQIDDYLVYGRETDSSPFNWEIVPYRKGGWKFWKQLKVWWNIAFGGFSILRSERERLAHNLRHELSLTPYAEVRGTLPSPADDPFRNQTIIEKQRIFEGKEINVLYSHAPIAHGEENLHFLIVPKQHRQAFSDLTKSEYIEAMQLSQQLIRHYKEKGHGIAYLFHKTGEEAGQTIPHWIEHIVFVKTKAQAFFSKLTILKNMLIGPSPLPEDELKHRVESLREELCEPLSA